MTHGSHPQGPTGDILLLRVFVGEDEVEHQVFARDKVIIGRDPYADICLEDAKISRLHTTIERDGTQHVVLNHGANGTLVNGKRFDRCVIKSGDELGISRFRIIVEVHAQTSASYYESARALGLNVDVEQTMRSPDHK